MTACFETTNVPSLACKGSAIFEINKKNDEDRQNLKIGTNKLCNKCT